MGAVLALSFMKPVAALAAAVTLLAACGENASQSRTMLGAFTSALSGPSQQPDLRAVLTREQIEAEGGNFLFAEIKSRDAQSVLVPGVETPRASTWLTPDGISLTNRGGFLIATRGLGHDLMVADVSGVQVAIASGGGTATRTHEYLDGNDQIQTERYSCTITRDGAQTIEIFERRYATTAYSENCNGSSNFTNRYWIDGKGVVWRAKQWVSPAIGYLEIDVL